MLEFHVAGASDVREVDCLLGELPGCFKAMSGSTVNCASSGRCRHEGRLMSSREPVVRPASCPLEFSYVGL
jgi:hypothetical protein